jgi:hypothetical protein
VAYSSWLRYTVPVLLALSAIGGCYGRTPRIASGPPKSASLYKDVAQERGIQFHWGTHGKSPLTNLDTFGCGCAFLDADGDGWMDVLLVGEPTCALFLNQRDGTFRDVTAAAQLDRVRGAWKGCAVADYDADGHPDILLTGYNCLALLHGGARLQWKDVTHQAGLRPQGWSSSAGFMDLDGHGWLDLVVGSYVVFNAHTPKFCEMRPGILSGCPPAEYHPQFAHVYRNDGHGGFVDQSDLAGMPSTHGKALAVSFCDYNADGRPDFYLANDGTPGDLMQNLGGGRFKNVGMETGAALGVLGQAQAGMGADWGDYDRDGRFDLAVSAFSGEPYSLYQNVGEVFEHTAVSTGIADATRLSLGFGVKFTDFDNDGWLDLIFVNGHVYDNVAQVEAGLTYRQPTMLFQNQQGRHFDLLGAAAGPDLNKPILGRGLACGDFDNDGREDLLVVDYEGSPLLLHNQSPPNRHWLTVDLLGPTKNRASYGARVEIFAGKERWLGQVSPASAYLSSSDPRVHFGLGSTDSLDRLVISWPDGKRQEIAHPAVDRIFRATEPEP